MPWHRRILARVLGTLAILASVATTILLLTRMKRRRVRPMTTDNVYPCFFQLGLTMCHLSMTDGPAMCFLPYPVRVFAFGLDQYIDLLLQISIGVP